MPRKRTMSKIEEARIHGKRGYLTKTKTIDKDGIRHWYIGSYPNEEKLEKAIEKRKHFGNFAKVPLNQLSILRVPSNGKIRLYVGLKTDPWRTAQETIVSPDLSVLRE